MTRAIALLLVLLAAPVWAQEVVVEKNGVKAGVRFNKDGTADDLIWKKSAKSLWLGRTKHERHGPKRFPDDVPPLDGIGSSALSGDIAPASDTARYVGDVLYLFTPAVAAKRGGDAAMPAFVELLRVLAQQTYDNSQVFITRRVVHVARVEYVETSNITTDLNRLGAVNDGIMDEIHSLRNQYGADHVVMLGTGYVQFGACGVAYRPAAAESAFAVVDEECAASNLSDVHEVGHNYNGRHDPVTECGQAVCTGSNYGHSWGPERSIMAYPGAGGIRTTQIANPNVFKNGFATGIAGQRDNAAAMNAWAPRVSNFRATVVVDPVPAPRSSGVAPIPKV